MYIADHAEGLVSVSGQDELLAHLQSVRKGPYGAFILWHGNNLDVVTGPALLVHINDDVAFLYFLPDDSGGHPGFQPTGISPADCPESVHFMQTDGLEQAGFTIDRDWLVSVAVAYEAAAEFLKEPALPASISWFEL